MSNFSEKVDMVRFDLIFPHGSTGPINTAQVRGGRSEEGGSDRNGSQGDGGLLASGRTLRSSGDLPQACVTDPLIVEGERNCRDGDIESYSASQHVLHTRKAELP